MIRGLLAHCRTVVIGALMMIYGFYPTVNAQQGSYAGLTAQAHTPVVLAENSHQARNLEGKLQQLSELYQVEFVYESKWVKNKALNSQAADKGSLKQQLKSLLTPLGLKFEQVNERTYAIFPKPKEKVKTLNPISDTKEKDRETEKEMIERIMNRGENLSVEAIDVETLAPVRYIVSGIVRDPDGEPLEGVTVLVKGSQVGALTNAEGRFQLDLKEDQNDVTLIVSYYGFERQEIPLNGRREIDITMQSKVNMMDEVVVIGYGTKQRRDITGAVSSIGSEELQQVAIQSLDQALQGRAPGVVVTQNSGAPGGNVSVRIRGVGSTGNNEPLYVIDGFPLYNDNNRSGSAGFGDVQFNALASLNPADIESIEVLKDASAAAIYGARAANGVVLITTKRGQAGAAKVTFDAYAGIQEAWKVPEFMNAEQFAEIANEAYINADLDPNPEWANPASLGEGTDWMEEMFRTGIIQGYDLGIRGGTERTQAAVSFGYFNQEGILIESDFERFSLRANVDFKATEKLRFGASVTGSFSDQQVLRTNNFANGAFNIAQMAYPTLGPNDFVDGPALYYSTALDNPVLRAQTEESDLSMIRNMATAFGEFEILPGLTYKLNVGADLILGRSTRWVPSFERGLVVQPLASSWERRTQDITYLVENTLTYQNTFADKHELLVLAGQSAQESNFFSLSGDGQDFQNNDIRVISASNGDLRNANGGANQWTLASYFGRINYTFDDKYLFTASLRVDGSSRFGPNNKWGVFPSFSAGWRLSNEDFLKDSDIIEDLKVRASWGQLGSDRIGNFGFLNIYSVGGVEYTINETGQPGAVLSRLGNPDLRWETSTQLDIGFDLSLLQGRFYVTADYFIKNTEDLLVAVPIPQTVGIGNNPFVNAGEVRNRGLELALGTQGGDGDFSYDINVNFATIDNEVISLGDGQPIPGGSFAGADRFSPTLTEVGQPIGYFFGFQVDGIYQTEAEIDPEFAPLAVPGDFRFRDVNGDGQLTDDDRTFLGSPIPDFTYGLNVSLKWKDFDFNFFVQGVAGNEIFSTIKQQTYQVPYFNGSGVTNSVTEILGRWTGPGTSNTIPRVSYEDPNGNYPRASSFYVEDGSFIRMRNLTVGYTLPASVINRIGLSRLRIYAGAQNLFTITDYTGFDPEIGDFNQNALASGVDTGNYPVPRTFKLGINLEL